VTLVPAVTNGVSALDLCRDSGRGASAFESGDVLVYGAESTW
jgi:hypothetical protein